jgi:uncharacterized protein YgiM (DUF1202 family)
MQTTRARFCANVQLFFLIFAMTAAAQQSAKRDTSNENTTKEISQDLAQLDTLVRKLAVSAQETSSPGPDNWSWQTGRAEPMVYFQDSYQAKTKPSEDANSTVMFRKGEKAQILKTQDNWALVADSSGATGWVDRKALSIVDSVQRQMEEVMPQIIAHLQAMKAKYQQGPVRVSGFTIDLKFPPGVSVEFEFK